MGDKTSNEFDYKSVIQNIEQADAELNELLSSEPFDVNSVEYKEGDKAVKIVEGGYIKIVNEELLLKILLADENNKSGIPYSEIKATYDQMLKMGERMLITVLKRNNIYIPLHEYQSVVNYALFQTIKEFDPRSRGSFSTFFFTKLLGEVTSLSRKTKAVTKGVYSSINDNSDLTNDILIETKESSTGTYGEAVVVSNDNPEDEVVEEDFRRRQLKAFRMAFSGIPHNQQILLYNFVNGIALKDLAPAMNMSEKELFNLRDRAISLLLQRVIRSSHITEEEKLDILKLQGLADDDATKLEDVLEYNYRNIDERKNF